MGGSAFGSKYDQMEFTNRQLFGKTDYSLAEKWVASGIAFGGEVVSEKLSYGVFKGKAKGVSDKIINRVKYSFSKNVYETAKRVGKRTISNTPYMYQESVGEVFAEFSNNVGDKYVLGENISLGKGLKGAALSGLFMERAMSMPGLYQDASSIFAGKDYKQKITENTEKRIVIENMLKEPGLSNELRTKLENDALKLVAKSETLMAKNVENINMMKNVEKENLVKIDGEIVAKRAEEDAFVSWSIKHFPALSVFNSKHFISIIIITTTFFPNITGLNCWHKYFLGTNFILFFSYYLFNFFHHFKT